MISVVIPAYNEEKALPATLAQLLSQHGRYEVIVADGGSADRTREIALSHPQVKVVEAPKGRASQMNTGAHLACGEWLLFLHADSCLPEGALALLEALETEPDCRAGAFRHRFTGDDWRLRLVSWLHNRRCSITGVMYGDQAMFVRRHLFHQLGGFPATPILEDVMFSEKLLAVTRPVLLEEVVLADSRKFVQMGIFRSLARVLTILVCHSLRLPIRGRAFFQDVR